MKIKNIDKFPISLHFTKAGYREEKEIKEASRKLKDEHLGRIRDPGSYSSPRLVAMVDILEWVLGDRQRLPDFE